MIKKYWTVKNGVIGTAHINRNGVEVDFRPSSWTTVLSEFPNRYFLEVIPWSGVGIPALRVDVQQVTETEPEDKEELENWYATIRYIGNFRGVDVTATRQAFRVAPQTEQRQREAGKAFRAAVEDAKRRWESLLALTPEEFRAEAGNRLTHEMWGRISSPYRERYHNALNEILRGLLLPEDVRLLSYHHSTAVWADQMKKGLLEIWEGEREKRKSVWMNRPERYEIKVFHNDHGVDTDTINWALRRIVPSPGAFFLKTLRLPKQHPPLLNRLYGPRCGDAPVRDAEVAVRDASDPYRPETPFVTRPARPTRLLTVIGVCDSTDPGKVTVFTAYGGPAASRLPDDPSLKKGSPEHAEAVAFWRDHALAK